MVDSLLQVLAAVALTSLYVALIARAGHRLNERDRSGIRHSSAIRISDETVRKLTEGQGVSFTRYIKRIARDINRERLR